MGTSRPRIALGINQVTGKVQVNHNEEKCRVILQADGWLKVGCTDVSIEALEYLVKEYRERFPQTKEVILQ